jgi:hypothetical protein
MKIINTRTAPASPNPHGVHASMIHDTEHVQAVEIITNEVILSLQWVRLISRKTLMSI